MPELPEVETIKKTLETKLINKKIKSIEIIYDKIIDGDVDLFINRLTNQTITKIDRIGKYLIFVLEDDAFISHLRMEGKYFVVSSDEPILKHCHVIFHLDQNIDLRYFDTRKFGRMELVSHDNYKNEQPFSRLGQEPFDIDTKVLYEKFKNSSRPIKDILLEQSIILGIGNIYANEICFKIKIHPETPAKNLSFERVEELKQASIEVLNEAIKQGGTTIHTFSADGIDGKFQVMLKVHGKVKQPCENCGTIIEKIKIKGRGTYYCPHCQSGRK